MYIKSLRACGDDFKLWNFVDFFRNQGPVWIFIWKGYLLEARN